jgi:putative oxidoreductase
MIPASVRQFGTDLGLFAHRAAFGLFMLLGHGVGKLNAFMDPEAMKALGEKTAEESSMVLVANTIGLDVNMAMLGAVGAELVCAALVVLGIATRLTTLPLVFTMAMAAFVAHGADGFAGQEKALLFMAGFALLFFTGPGRLSVDGIVGGMMSRKRIEKAKEKEQAKRG